MKTLRDALRAEEPALTAELSLNPRQTPTDVIGQARILGEMTDAIQIPELRHFRPHMSNIAVAAMLLQEGLDPVIQMNSRDRNRIALQSDMLGARALGANNLLLMRGSNFPADHLPRCTGVFDVGAIDLIATAAAIRDEEVFAGSKPDGVPDLYLGAIALAFDPASTWAPEKLTSKADAGAQFIQLQLCLDLDVLRAYMARIVTAKLTWRLQFLAALAIFSSAEDMRRFRQDRPDSVIPAALVKRLEKAVDPVAEGIAIAAEQLHDMAAIPGIAGVTLTTTGDPASITAAVRASGIRPDRNRG